MRARRSGSRRWFPLDIFCEGSGTGSRGGSEVVPTQFPPMGTGVAAPGGSRGSPPLIGELRNRSGRNRWRERPKSRNEERVRRVRHATELQERIAVAVMSAELDGAASWARLEREEGIDEPIESSDVTTAHAAVGHRRECTRNQAWRTSARRVLSPDVRTLTASARKLVDGRDPCRRLEREEHDDDG
jgi:hypothetical protein